MDKQEEEEKKVKELNREIMFVFEKHTLLLDMLQQRY